MPNTTSPRAALQLGAITINDAESIARTIDSAEAGLCQAVAQVQVLLRTRDLSDVWDPENHAWPKQFEPIALRITQLQAALRVLVDDPEVTTGLAALDN